MVARNPQRRYATASTWACGPLSDNSQERLRSNRPDRSAKQHALNDLLPRLRHGRLEFDIGRIER